MKNVWNKFVMLLGVNYIWMTFLEPDSDWGLAFKVFVKALILATVIVIFPWLFDLLRKWWKQRREETV